MGMMSAACKILLSVALVYRSGVFRATRLRLNPRQRASHALFKTYLDVVHVQKEETDKLFRPRGANTTQASGQQHLFLLGRRWHTSGSCCVHLFVQAGCTMQCQSWLCPGMSGVVHCPGRVLVAASFHRLDADNHRCCACCCRLLVRLCGPA
jgi:hypothetical protein